MTKLSWLVKASLKAQKLFKQDPDRKIYGKVPLTMQEFEHFWLAIGHPSLLQDVQTTFEQLPFRHQFLILCTAERLKMPKQLFDPLLKRANAVSALNGQALVMGFNIIEFAILYYDQTDITSKVLLWLAQGFHYVLAKNNKLAGRHGKPIDFSGMMKAYMQDSGQPTSFEYYLREARALNGGDSTENHVCAGNAHYVRGRDTYKFEYESWVHLYVGSSPYCDRHGVDIRPKSVPAIRRPQHEVDACDPGHGLQWAVEKGLVIPSRW